jgi:purine-binding chemotaxis protein CheW
LALDPQRVLLVFYAGGQSAALPLENVKRIASMVQLVRPPGLPAPLEGILNLGGTAVPVVRLDRLLGRPVQEVGLYSMLIILKDSIDVGFALLVERTSEVVSVPCGELLPIDKGDSFNACAGASFLLRGETVPLLSPQRILLEKEKLALSEFQMLAQQRVGEWRATDQ